MRNKNEMLDEMIEFVESIILRELEPEEIDYIRTNGDEKFLETLDIYGNDVDAIIDLRNILSAYITETEDDTAYWDYLGNTNPDAIEIMRNIVTEYDELNSDNDSDEEDEEDNTCTCDEEENKCCDEECEKCPCDPNKHLYDMVEFMNNGNVIKCSEEEFETLSDFVSEHYVNFILRYENGEATMKIVG